MNLLPNSVTKLQSWPTVLSPENMSSLEITIHQEIIFSKYTEENKKKYTNSDINDFLFSILKQPTIFLRNLSFHDIYIDIFIKPDSTELDEFLEIFHENFPNTNVHLKKFITESKIFINNVRPFSKCNLLQ
jgi:hypothetical protein